MIHLRRFGFAYFLLLAFIGSWAGQLAAQVEQVRNEAADHQQPFSWTEFWPEFWSSTLENWQSEFLQLLVQALGMVILASFVFKRAEEDMDRLERKVDRLLAERED